MYLYTFTSVEICEMTYFLKFVPGEASVTGSRRCHGGTFGRPSGLGESDRVHTVVRRLRRGHR